MVSWMCAFWVRFQFLQCSSVVCLYLDVFIGGFRWGMPLGVGKAMLMRGGACATELCLMVVWVCVFVSSWGWFSCCGLWRCVFLFLLFGVFEVSLFLVWLVVVMGVYFPLDRVYLGSFCLCYVFGDRLGLGSPGECHA